MVFTPFSGQETSPLVIKDVQKIHRSFLQLVETGNGQQGTLDYSQCHIPL